MVSSVSYLWYWIEKDGIHPMPDKVCTVKEASMPRSYSRTSDSYHIITNSCHISSCFYPLHELLHWYTPWNRSSSANESAEASKSLLTIDQVLIYFDSSLDLILQCDAYPYGVGAVFTHQLPDGSERSIAFISRTLSETEKKYRQVEEALACIFGVKKFRCYLHGKKFILSTDHNPLISLFIASRPISVQSSARIQHWALMLGAYEFEFHHKSAVNHGNADALSRIPWNNIPNSTQLLPELIVLINHLSITVKQISVWSKSDPLLSIVFQYAMADWPEACVMKPFWRCRNELSVLNDCLLWASKIIIPPPGREHLSSEIHEGHFGIRRTKAKPRSIIWWPGIMRILVNSCDKCQQESTPCIY